jgi:hypothetical protein
MINRQPDKYLGTKIVFARVFGILVLIVSAIFSQSGFGFSEPNLAWVGWILAGAVTVAQLIFNTKLEKLNWTIATVGIMAYVYSIYTNIVGFYAIKGTSFVLNGDAIIPILGSVFLDIFPEMALAWSFGASSDGDVIGNLKKLADDPRPFSEKMQPQIPEQIRNRQMKRDYSPPAGVPPYFPPLPDDKLMTAMDAQRRIMNRKENK